ncbi:MAG: hypothetical protein ACRCSU_07335 [Paracoccaceae bacterium]
MAELVAVLGLGAKATGILSSIATIAGPVLGVAGAVQGVAEGGKQAAEYSRQAREERVMAGIQAARMRRAARQKQSADRTAMAEGGALSGSAFGVLEQNALAQELDALTVTFQGEQAARGLEFQAKQSRVSPLTIFSSAVEGFSSMDPLNLAPNGGAGG